MKIKILACKKDLILTEAPIYFLYIHSFSKHQKEHIPFPSNIWAQLIRKPIQLCTLWFTDYGNSKDSSNLKGHRRCFVLFPLMALMGIICARDSPARLYISFRCSPGYFIQMCNLMIAQIKNHQLVLFGVKSKGRIYTNQNQMFCLIQMLTLTFI